MLRVKFCYNFFDKDIYLYDTHVEKDMESIKGGRGIRGNINKTVPCM